MIKKQFVKAKSVYKTTFSLPVDAAPQAKTVVLVGDFNDWNQENAIAMKKLKGEFKATVELPVGKEYQFRYLINGEQWENDWQADNYVPTPFGGENSVVSTLN